MNKIEIATILGAAKLTFNQTLTELEIKAWLRFFEKIDARIFGYAIEAAIKTSGNFFPTPGAVQRFVEVLMLPDTIILSSAEALDKMELSDSLTLDALEFANRSTPKADGQYNSPEELDQANRIHKATWNRNFRERYERSLDTVKTLVRMGVPIQTALDRVASSRRLNTAEATLVNMVTAPQFKVS